MSAPCPVFGFNVTIAMAASVGEATTDAIVLDFIETLEANGLSAGGGGDRTFEFVIERDGGQATASDRDIILRWSEKWRPSVAVLVSDLLDLNEVES